jgi:hypothetical protein
METSIRQDAVDFLHSLTEQPLLYAIKSPDTDLYDFGFGELVEVVSRRGSKRKIGTHILHAICRFKVIWKNGEHRVDKYYEDTSFEKFHAEIQHLFGLKVKRVALSDKNDLWLDFGDYWIVFATYENGEESWRFFTSNVDVPHLVASDSWLYFSG